MRINPCEDNCSGCGFCEFVCLKSAIQMKEDFKGFLYPYIDDNLCINCSRCSASCTFNNLDRAREPVHYFLSKALSTETVMASTSGGMYTVLSDVILSSGGIVYSPDFDDDMVLKHKKIVDVINRNNSRGSKYVQSQLSRNIYASILQDLETGLEVLFCGTPCQVNSINHNVPNNLKDNLYTLDVICNGVGSPFIWKSHVHSIESKKNKKVVGYNFRPKTKKYLTLTEVCSFSDGSSDEIAYAPRKYNPLYYSGLITRPSCTNCKFATGRRVSDITIGDFSDAKEHFPEYDSKLGASSLLIISSQGIKLYKRIVKNIDSIELMKEDCEQVRLNKCSEPNHKSNLFYEEVRKKCLYEAVDAKFSAFSKLKMHIGAVLYLVKK